MNPKIRKRLDLVTKAMESVSISLQGVPAELQIRAKKISSVLDVPYGTLIRTALAIQKLDHASSLEGAHLQEAVQHIILKDDL